MEKAENMLQEAASKMGTTIGDIEDLAIAKNHNINILDVLEDLKEIREIIHYAHSKIANSEVKMFRERNSKSSKPFEFDGTNNR